MKKTMRYLGLAAFIAAGTLLAGCSKEEEQTENQGIETENVVVTLTARVSLGNTSSKAVNGDGVKTFAVGDQIAVVYTNTSTETVKATSQALTAGDISNAKKSAQFTVTLINPVAGSVRYVYPASMVDDSGEMTSLASQDGTLAGLQAFDYAEGSGTMTSTALPAIDLTNQIAVGKFTLKDYTGTTDLTGISSLTVYSDGQSYTITPASTLSDTVYVAMKPITDKAVSFKASDGTYTYWKLVPSATLAASNFYPVNVTMGYPGVLPGQFSVGSTSQVYFSRGNLQATGTILSSPASGWAWAFAEDQYGFIGSAVANNAICDNGFVSTGGTVDLFGCSTDNALNYHGLHNYNSSQSTSFAGGFDDWGKLAISNGGNAANSGWRTPDQGEWSYLFQTRDNFAGKYGYATVSGVTGVVVLPDAWSLPEGCSFTAGMANGWTTNSYDADKWAQMEAFGAVFLPAAGNRYTTSVAEVGTGGYYWSSTFKNSAKAYVLSFNETNDLSVTADIDCYVGLSVRLVMDSANAFLNQPASSSTLNGGDFYGFLHNGGNELYE